MRRSTGHRRAGEETGTAGRWGRSEREYGRVAGAVGRAGGRKAAWKGGQ